MRASNEVGLATSKELGFEMKPLTQARFIPCGGASEEAAKASPASSGNGGLPRQAVEQHASRHFLITSMFCHRRRRARNWNVTSKVEIRRDRIGS
jgi:hypothetical protein